MDAWVVLAVLAKSLLYAGVLLAAGTTLFRWLFAWRLQEVQLPLRTALWIFVGIGLFSSIANFAISAALLTGDMRGMIDAEMLGILWQTPAGTALFWRVIGFGIIVVGLLTRGFAWPIAMGGSAITLQTFAQVGHVHLGIDDGIGASVAPLLLLVHLGGIALWVGVLWPLYRMTASVVHMADASRVAERFGRLALYFVPVLLAAGGGLTYLLVDTPAELVSSGYGRTILAKLGLVAVLLGFAAANKFRFVPRLRHGDVGALRSLHRAVTAEIVLFAGVFVCAAALSRCVAC